MTVSPRRTVPEEGQTGLEELLLVLDQIRVRAMGPEQRLAMLRALRDRVETLATGLLPTRRPHPGGPRPDPAECLCACLNEAWCGNLRHLLSELGHPRAAGQSRFVVYREWVVRQLMKDLGRLVEAGVRAGQAAPRGTWHALHDLFFYLDGRDEVSGAGECGHFSPGTEYKRLLLLGALGEEPQAPRLLAEVEHRLGGWAAASTLRRDARIVGESALLRLDLNSDGPPRRSRPGDPQPYHGWVLEPAPAFMTLLARRSPGEPDLAAAA